MVDQTYISLAEDEEKPEYPELYFMMDGANTLVSQMNEFEEESEDEDDENPQTGYALVIQDTEYWPDIYQSVRHFSESMVEELEGGRLLIAPIAKEELENVIDAYTRIGFIVRKASDQDHDELIREFDKLATVEGGESKDYPRGKGA